LAALWMAFETLVNQLISRVKFDTYLISGFSLETLFTGHFSSFHLNLFLWPPLNLSSLLLPPKRTG
jgi:hypothetical protein